MDEEKCCEKCCENCFYASEIFEGKADKRKKVPGVVRCCYARYACMPLWIVELMGEEGGYNQLEIADTGCAVWAERIEKEPEEETEEKEEEGE